MLIDARYTTGGEENTRAGVYLRKIFNHLALICKFKKLVYMQAAYDLSFPWGKLASAARLMSGLKKVWSSYQPDPGDRLRNGI
jgi:hypothetical protein